MAEGIAHEIDCSGLPGSILPAVSESTRVTASNITDDVPASCLSAASGLPPLGDAEVREALANLHVHYVAAEVHLSADRFSHLFASQTGASLRAWLLWTRMEGAVTSTFQGRSRTEAAHEAGFAAAHLTRTCRRMIGLAPPMLVPEAPSART